MNCQYCQTWNGEYEHRCVRCARKLYESVPELEPAFAAPSRYESGTAAVLLGPERHYHTAAQPERMLRHMSPDSVAYAPVSSGGYLPPYEESGAHSAVAPHYPEELSITVTQDRRPLRTSIEAVIYSDAPIAHPVHRGLALALDASLITIATGLFLLTLHYGGYAFTRQPLNIGAIGTALGLIILLYQAIWAAAGTDTPGMRWTHMQLLDFDGNRPSRWQRFSRLLTTGLSLLSCGLGVVWMLVDEEGLSWHDHLSRTFPSLRPICH